MQYHQDEKVLCFHGPLIYQAKSGATGPHYLVHYQGWKKTWDEWVPETRLLKFNEENLARQKALVDAQKAEAAAAAAVAAAHEQNARGKAEARRSTSTSSTAGASRGSKRSRDASEADGHEKRPDIRLHIPDSLKAVLVDDWENITRKEQLVPLPRHPNVKDILREYAAYYEAAAPRRPASRASQSQILDEVLAGLKLYFDKSLAQNLLYRFERRQYVEMRKRLCPKTSDGHADTEATATKPTARRARTSAPETSESVSAAELEASAVYGAEHLLRLFVNLPDIVAHTTMDPESVSILREHLNEFLAFLAKEQPRLFVREYEAPSQAYQRLGST